jgi:AMP nucleosidase
MALRKLDLYRGGYGVGHDRGQRLSVSVPYASFLCVSDRPLHGDLKMEGIAEAFYRDAVARHFRIGISAVETLCHERNQEHGVRTLRLRKTTQPPFQ